MIRASAKRKTPINTRFLGVPYIHLEYDVSLYLPSRREDDRRYVTLDNPRTPPCKRSRSSGRRTAPNGTGLLRIGSEDLYSYRL